MAYGLSISQYTLAAAIFHLSSNPRAPFVGWCSASKKQLAEFFGFSERNVFNLIDDLESRGWVERHPNQAEGFNGLVRTTAAWYDKIECFQPEDLTGLPVSAPAQHSADPMQKVHTPPMQKVQDPYAKSADNTNTNTNKGNSRVFERRAGAKKNEPQPESPASASQAGGGPADVGTRIEPTTAPEVIELADQIAAYFKVSETKFFHQYAQVRRMVKDLHGRGEYDFVVEQFTAYTLHRAAINTRPHNLDNWLGTAENDWLGHWRKQNWPALLADLNALDATRQPRQGKPAAVPTMERLGDGAAAALARLRAKAASNPENTYADE